MKKILPLCSLICLFSGVAYGMDVAQWMRDNGLTGEICGGPSPDGTVTPGCWEPKTKQSEPYCRAGECRAPHARRSGCVYWGSQVGDRDGVLGHTEEECGCAATCCEEGYYLWIWTNKGTCKWSMGICYSEEEMKGKCKCGTCSEGYECKPNIVKLECGMGFEDCSCQPINDNVVVTRDDPKPSEKCPDGTTGNWPYCVCKDKSKRWDKDKKECVPKCPDPDMVYNDQTDKCECKDKNKIPENGKCVAGEECYWENDLQIYCDCGVTLTEHQHFPVTKKFLKDMDILSCDDLKQKFRAAHASDQDMKIALNTPSSTFAGDRMTYALEMRKKICELACPSVRTSSGAEQRTMVVAYNPSATSTEAGPSKADIDSAKSVLDAAFSGEGSVWKDKEGKFNKARLASDLTAGVVLGTVGGVVSGVVIKKKQIEKGFEALHCTVGGQKVADWGDEFMVGFRR